MHINKQEQHQNGEKHLMSHIPSLQGLLVVGGLCSLLCSLRN